MPMEGELEVLPLGRAEVLCEGEDLLIIAIGNRVHPALEAAGVMAEAGVSATVVNARFVKPIDEDLIVPLAKNIGKVLTVEDGVLMGGFGSAVLEVLADRGSEVAVKRLGIPDRFIEHGDVDTLYDVCGCDQAAVVREGLRLAKKGIDDIGAIYEPQRKEASA